MLSDEKLTFLTQIAKGLAGQFGETAKSLSTKSMKTILTILLFPLKMVMSLVIWAMDLLK